MLYIWEYNDRGLIYSPLGETGQMNRHQDIRCMITLYLWALELSAQYFNDAKLVEKSQNWRN